MRRPSHLLGALLPVLIAGALAVMIGCGSSAQAAAAQVSIAAPGSLQTGPYFALVIGNNNYQYLPKLKTAINDANAVAKVLSERYGFKTQVLVDADRAGILTALVEYRRTLPDNSNLLIYYAGHGYHDRDTDRSYWLPVDARRDNNANWISSDDITSDIRAISSSHVLVISDSCYSGYLTRDADASIAPRERSAYLAKLLKSKSRNLMASGGDEPVLDSGAPGHSIFAAVVLDSLNRMEDEEFTANDLFYKFIQPGVGGRSEQLPQYSVIRNSGHVYGDFVFARTTYARAAAPLKSDIRPGETVAGAAAASPTSADTASVNRPAYTPPAPIPQPNQPSGVATGTAAGARHVAILDIRQAVRNTAEGKRDLSAAMLSGKDIDNKKLSDDPAGQRILKKMAPVIDKYAKGNGVTVILDSSDPWPQGPLLWAAAESDLTNSIIQVYDGGTASPGHGGSKHTGIIDIQQAIVATNEGARDFEALQKKFAPKKNELTALNSEVENLKKQLNTQGDSMTESARTTLSRSIESKQKTLQRQAEGAQNAFQQEQNEISQRILQKMAPVIDKYAKSNGFGLLLDSSNPWPQGPLLWATTNVDLTKVIVDQYNGQSGIAAPSGTSPKPANTPPPTGTGRVGIVDIQQALAGSREGAHDFAALGKKFEPKKNELASLNTEIENLKKQLSTQGNSMSAQARADLTKSIETKQASLKRSAEDAQTDYQQQQNEIAQRILQKMAPVIDKYAKSNSYGLLLDSSNPWPQGPVIWTTGGADITQPIIDAYNAVPATSQPSPSAAKH